MCLVTVCEASHSAHDTEDIVVGGVDAHLGFQVGALKRATKEWLDILDEADWETSGIDSAVLEKSVSVLNRQLQSGVVDTRKVSRTTWVVLLWADGKRVNVDTWAQWNVGVVLVWLHQVEVIAKASTEPIVTVQLKLGHLNWVTSKVGEAVVKCQAAEDISVVRPLVVSKNTLKVVDLALANQIIVLDNPDQLLHWVVEVQADLVGSVADALLTSELQLLNQVLVRDLGEAATLISVKVDVVNVHRGSIQAQVRQSWVGCDD